MRIVIDLQGAQTESRFRGIGRYSLALALGMARNAGEHELWIVLNTALAESISDIRRAFEGLIPNERIRVFDVPTPLAELDPGNAWRARAAEKIREHFIQQLQPDAVLVTSLFEGYVDNGVASVGAFCGAKNTAVILYDLIPFLNPASYLTSPSQKQYYERKIQSLRKAGLLLSISDYSRQEAIDALGLNPDNIVSISTAVDACFKPDSRTPQQAAELRQRFGITRKMVMYAPGGFDARKNIDGLITAYSLLPGDLRADHQLVIASKLGNVERSHWNQMRKRAGLAADELVLTGYVTDQDLGGLYSAANLFVFPSKHEGFGLPALEAMACGAPVIGSNSTSIPEVIDLEEALFDPASPQSIAAKMAQVLRDEQLRSRLREHGLAQAKKFSWDASAQRALRALEAHASTTASPAAVTSVDTPANKKPRLAFVSPLPPERTGIADYSADLLPELAHYFDIELVTDQAEIVLPPALSALPRRSVSWFAANGADYDKIVYQFGNSPFHSHMFELLHQHPGVVVLHDLFLSGVLAYEETTGGMPGAWTEALYHSHGYLAVQASFGPKGMENAKDTYPCSLDVIQSARGVIVHSEYAQRLARQWYGAQASASWKVIPLLRTPPAIADRSAARKALGISEDAFLVCSFGFIDPTKLSHRLIEAWLSSRLRTNQHCELVLVGANHGGDFGLKLADRIRDSGSQNRIRITGWTDVAVYRQYLQAADVGVQLRGISRGETSAAALDCMNYGLAAIVNANGSMADLPQDAVWKLPESFSDAELVAALESLWENSVKRAELGSTARQVIRTWHSPDQCAKQYTDAIDAAYQDADTDLHALLQSLAAIPDLPATEPALQQLAQSIAISNAKWVGPRQLLVDVSAIARNDLQTGIERVVRAQLFELLRNPPAGFRVEPVYLSSEGGAWHYRYAQHYTRKLLAIDIATARDAPVDIAAGDVFYSPDFYPGGIIEAAQSGLYADWKARGVEINFLIHDILPVLRPDFFPPHADDLHAQWLDCIAEQADRLVCISNAVADEVRLTLTQRGHAGLKHLKFAVVHHGADIGASVPSSGMPADAPQLLKQLAATPSFLMVGTIEPRKGHLQTLAAFEQLWRDGEQVNLVIVGKEGWKALATSQRRTIPEIMDRLRNHPELGKRLFWLQGISDEYLQKVYAASACLVFASEGEGFGLPLIEAAQTKLPIIARDLPVFREVAQQHAYYFSGLDGADLAGAIREWMKLEADGKAPSSAAMQWRTWAQNAEELGAVLVGGKVVHS
jgi:glycosyltransferase involved in cell wall biosynthesis